MVRALNPSQFRSRPHFEPSSLPRNTILRQSTEVLQGGLCWANFWVSDGTLVRVPALNGLTREAATERLQNAQLGIAIAEAPSTTQIGRVISQDPAADNEVPRNSIVRAEIAIQMLIDVPDVTGLPLPTARGKLRQFQVDTEDTAAVRPIGKVVDQDPRPPARRAPGDRVKLMVSDGSLVAVPPVQGLQLDAARQRLSDDQDGLRAEVAQRESGAEPNVVLEQTPMPGDLVKRGSIVRVVVSTGLAVPDVIGATSDEARRRLAPFKVEQTTVEGLEPTGQVIDQDPKAPIRASADTTIRLRVSDGSLVRTPDVLSLMLAAARAKLDQSGLGAQVRSGPNRNDAIVTVQEPVAGTAAKRGSEIRLDLVAPPTDPLWYVAAGAGAIATLLLGWWIVPKVFPPKPPHPPTPPVRVTAALDPSLTHTHVEGAKQSGPTLRVETRLEPGPYKIEFSNREQR